MQANLQYAYIFLANGTWKYLVMIVDRDEFGPETETNDRDIDLLVAHLCQNCHRNEPRSSRAVTRLELKKVAGGSDRSVVGLSTRKSYWRVAPIGSILRNYRRAEACLTFSSSD